MRRAVAILAIAFLLGACRHEQRPNVVLLVMDTTRADRCSFNGYQRPTTPRLNDFAKDAVVFTEAWAPDGWTGPTHASLFTGLHPDRHGFVEGNRPFLAEESVTLAERLGAAGYATACFSNNWVVSAEWGLAQGFAHYEAMYKVERKATPARETHRRAIEWARAKQSEKAPFFLFINDIEAHLPYEPDPLIAAGFLRDSPPPEELAEARKFNHPDGIGYIIGAVKVPPQRIEILSDLYDGEIAALDAEIGTLLDALREAGLLDNTIIVITSDHGENIGDHGMLDHKFSLHRTLTHIPLIIRYPGHFDGGRKVTSTVRLEDIAPTIHELVGIDAPGLDGRSLSRDLEGRLALSVWGVWARHEAELMVRFPGSDLSPLYTSIRAVYDGRHHYIRYSDGREELYDVSVDPAEADNLVTRDSTLRDRMVPLVGTP